MTETLLRLPSSFWITIIALSVCGVWAVTKVKSGLGLPMLVGLVTVTTWYVVDLFYNGYEYYDETFTAELMARAWWQVALFVIAFGLLTPAIHRLINARYYWGTSSIYTLTCNGAADYNLQKRLHHLWRVALIVWMLLSIVAILRDKGESFYYFFPYLGHRDDPWSRARIGTGFDSLISVADNLEIFLSASFGVCAALLQNSRLRSLALVACGLSWPYFILDRTRNTMLAIALPGILAWVFVRLRVDWLTKVAVLAASFALINLWFAFVIANRSNMTITEALNEKGFDAADMTKVHHDGLNMFEELCWINLLTESGVYQPTVGESYLAEVASPIPRPLWPDKPTIGLDYAVARGMKNSDLGLGTTLATGMIGQGVISFGTFFGPIFAALLTGVWSAILARIDLQGKDVMLYGFGLILTFNLGRDITTITLYSFIFGWLLVWLKNRYTKNNGESEVRELEWSTGY